MDLFSNLSDDQLALVGCAGALLVSGVLMSLSVRIRRSKVKPAAVPEPPVRESVPMHSDKDSIRPAA